MAESETPEKINMEDMEGSFKEERQTGGGVPSATMPRPHHRGVSEEGGDQFADMHSQGTGGPTGAPNVEFAYGNPGAEMKKRRDQEPQDNVQVDSVSPLVEPSMQPQKCNMTPVDIADQLYSWGIEYYRFFVSDSLPAGVQWLFPSKMVLMINQDDFFIVKKLLHEFMNVLFTSSGQGFVGDPTSLYDDPTLGPLMAMGGMFHVKKEPIDE